MKKKKPSKRNRKPSPALAPIKKSTRYWHSAIAIVVIGALIYFVATRHSPPPTQTSKVPTIKESPKVLDGYQAIASKLSRKQVKSRFSPIHIWHVETSNTAKFVGSGSTFTTKNGEEQIITSEHLFSKNFGKSKFLWRKLRPLDVELTSRGIAKILYRGKDLSRNPNYASDVAILKCGEMQDIDCFYDEPGDEMIFGAEVNLPPQPKMLTSLVTGEKVRVLGTSKEPGENAVTYTLIEYANILGESGTGFVDENDEIYVLKGEYHVAPENQAEMKMVMGNPKAMSRVYGPLHFNE